MKRNRRGFFNGYWKKAIADKLRPIEIFTGRYNYRAWYIRTLIKKLCAIGGHCRGDLSIGDREKWPRIFDGLMSSESMIETVVYFILCVDDWIAERKERWGFVVSGLNRHRRFATCVICFAWEGFDLGLLKR